jgi:hypothetical protein
MFQFGDEAVSTEYLFLQVQLKHQRQKSKSRSSKTNILHFLAVESGENTEIDMNFYCLTFTVTTGLLNKNCNLCVGIFSIDCFDT